MPLNPKQQRFVEEYLVDFNATQAAVRAGYSKATAGQIGGKLLKKVEIASAIAAWQDGQSKKLGISADWVLREIALIARADPRDLMKWGPKGVVLIDSKTLTRDQAAIVSEVAQTKDGIRLKTHSKLDALEKLVKHLGLNAPEKVEHSGAVEVAEPAEFARRIAFLLTKGAAEAGKGEA